MQAPEVVAAAGVSAAAVHDTVAAIVRQPGYDRSLRQSLADVFFRWLGEMFERVLGVVELPDSRRIATVLAVALAILVVARILYAARLADDEWRLGRSASARRRAASDPLHEAERLAAEGRFADAAHALYRALLLRLSGRERLKLHPSKTSGEYARELRSHGSPAYASFRRFGRRYERLLFGHDTFDAAAYAALLAEARPLLDAEAPGGGAPEGRAA